MTNGGPTVPREILARLSRPFERGHAAAEGVGLGLAIASAIASGSGKELTLTSPPDGQVSGFEAKFAAGKHAS